MKLTSTLTVLLSASVLAFGCGVSVHGGGDTSPKQTAHPTMTSSGQGGAGGANSTTTGTSSGQGGQGGQGGTASGPCFITLASGEQLPSGLAVDGTAAYWTNASSPNVMGGGNLSNGSVRKCAVGGCNLQPTTLASGQAAPGSIAVDATRVYWGNLGINGFGTDGSLQACALGGCGAMPAQLEQGAGPESLAVDATRVYWTVSGNGVGSLWSCAVAGCSPTQMAVVQGFPNNVAVNATTLAWTSYQGSFGGSVWTCTPGACTPTMLLSSPNAPVGFAMDAQNVYFTAGDAVMKCALGGCNGQPTTLAAGLGAPSSIVTDGVNVYFAVTPMGPGAAVMRCSVNGCNGQPTTVASGPGLVTPSALAVDATAVYWTDLNAGTVMKAPFDAPASCGSTPIPTSAASSTSSTTSTTSSTGGMCSGGACASPANCPKPVSDCTLRACAGGCCGTTPAPYGTPAAMQTSGDCHQILCDGANGFTTVVDDNDPPQGTDNCHVGACAGGTPMQNPLCTDPMQGCFAGQCFPSTCFDHVKDGQETDVDCGGSACPPCAHAQACLLASDCLDGACDATHHCGCTTFSDCTNPPPCFSSQGQCNAGACSYPGLLPCSTPPVCQHGPGYCSPMIGHCTYSTLNTVGDPCPGGSCFSGMCLPCSAQCAPPPPCHLPPTSCANFVCVYPNAPAGTACAGGACDANGHCGP